MARDAGVDRERIRAVLVRALQAVCPPWLADRREDLVQAAWLRVAEALERAGEVRSINDSYLWRTATSALIDEIRRVRAERRVLEPEHPGGSAEALSTLPDAQRAVEGREVREAIAACLARIVPARRRVVTLHLIGYTDAEAATFTGGDLKRTRNLLFRGLTALRDCLRQKGITP